MIKNTKKLSVYDRHYRKENYFGEPYAALKEFFEMQSRGLKKGSVCDLGAGQGRDSLYIASLGFDVTAVDLSVVGLQKITEQNEDIVVVEKDIYEYDTAGFDYVLLDNMLHLYQKNFDREKKLIDEICHKLPTGGVLINCMVKSLRTEKIFKKIMDDSEFSFKILDECYTDYPEFESTFYFIALQKV